MQYHILWLSPDLLGDSSSEKGPASKNIKPEENHIADCRIQQRKCRELKPAGVTGDGAVVQVDGSRCRTHTAGGLTPIGIEVYQTKSLVAIILAIFVVKSSRVDSFKDTSFICGGGTRTQTPIIYNDNSSKPSGNYELSILDFSNSITV